MVGRFNPNDPFTVGLEWPASYAVEDSIDNARELGYVVTPTANRTLWSGSVYTPSPPLGAEQFSQIMFVTVYERGKERAYGDVYEVQSAVVNAGSSTTGSLTGGAATVAEALASPGDGKAVRLLSASSQTVDFTFDAPTFAVPDPRILSVEFTYVVHNYDTDAVPATVSLWRMPAGALYANTVVPALTTQESRVATGEQLVSVWRPADLTLPWRLDNYYADCDIEYVSRKVTYCTENRLASGGNRFWNLPGDPTQWVPGWQPTFLFMDVASGSLAGVPLLAGREYTLTVTHASSWSSNDFAQNDVSDQYGTSRNIGALSPVRGGTALRPIVFQRFSDGRITPDPEVEVDRAWSVTCYEPGYAPILEMSQPYAVANPIVVANATQQVSSATGGLYGSLRATVRPKGSPGNLVFTVSSRTATLAPADLDGVATDAKGYATVTLPLTAPVTLSPGVAVTVTGAVGASADRWEIPTLSTAATGATYTGATYGGSTLVGQSDARYDYAIDLVTAVPTVTGAAVTHGFHPLTPLVTGCPTPLFHSLDYASVCWGNIPIVSGSPQITGSPLVTGFCAWEVERRDTVDDVWRRIARVTDRNILCVNDYEARIGVQSDYRIRLCRLDGACGGYATVTGFVRVGASTATAAPAVTGTGCDGLVFTANESPDMTVAYPYMFTGTPTEDFTFDEAATVVLQRMHMRDYQVAFRPLERGGVSFTRTMLTNALSVPPDRLDRGFDALRDIAWASLTYVCVLDMRGNRWFASVNVPTGTVRETNQVYMASVQVVETTDRPSVIDVEAV